VTGPENDAAEDARATVGNPSIRLRHTDRGVVLETTGEFDLANAKHLRTALAQALRDGSGVLVVDMTEVTFLGSVGLSLLVEANALAEPGALRIVAGDGAALRAIELTSLDQVLSMFATVDDALAASR
jgi:anti-anti-sigma factor